MRPRLIVFPPFTLDPTNELISRGAEAVSLRPKAFAVLRHLAERPGQLVTKEELLEVVWAGTFVSDTVLKVCINELRHALGDDAGAAQLIQTVHRRGYRFIAPVTTSDAATSVASAYGDPVVGRDAERRQLDEALAHALAGRRHVVFVGGEAGIGKTSLIDSFLRAAPPSHVWITRGQCVAQYGSGEAFLPVLEALDRLCRGTDGARVVELMRRVAPDWLQQLPGLASAEERAAWGQPGATAPERMLRLAVDLLEAVTVDRPLILVLEDMHWSDHSTVDLLARLAERQEAARLLVLVTYRPADAIARGHPLRAVEQELKIRRRCVEIQLGFLDEDATETYLATRFPGGPLPVGLVGWLQRRTDGNPLFMTNVVDELVAQGLVDDVDGGAIARLGFERVGVPENLRQMIEQQLDRLDPAEHDLLEAAAVAGAEFSAATVAAAVGRDVVDTETRLRAWARRGHLVRDGGLAVWPDGTVAAQLAFVHSLYREVQYQRIAPARRAQLHRRIGERLEAACGAESPKAPAELALHFEQSGDVERAVEYLKQGARQARRRGAHREAVACLVHAIDVLQSRPDTPERSRALLALHMSAAPSLVAINATSHVDVQRTYETALAIADAIGDTASSFMALTGLWGVYFARGDVDAGSRLSAKLLAIAADASIPVLLVVADTMVGMDSFYSGDLERAHSHFERARAAGRLQPIEGRPDVWGFCIGYSALTLCHLGHVAEARRRAAELLVRVDAQGDPFDQVMNLLTAFQLAMLLRDVPAASTLAERADRIAREHDVPRGDMARWARAWCRATAGDAAAVAEMTRCLDEFVAKGTRLGLSGFLADVARTRLEQGHSNEALDDLRAARDRLAGRGERIHEAEIHRLHGECLRALGRRDEAEGCFVQAIDTARRQHARWWELRATVSLAALLLDRRRATEARDLLQPIYESFDPSIEAPDLTDAKILLDRFLPRTSGRRRFEKLTKS